MFRHYLLNAFRNLLRNPLYTLINLAQTYFFYCSRIIFAWSFDRLVPEGISYIHPTLHSPIVAILIITLMTYGEGQIVSRSANR